VGFPAGVAQSGAIGPGQLVLVWAKPGTCTNLPGFLDAPPEAGFTATKTTVACSNIFRGSGVVNVLRRIPYPLSPTMFSFLHRFPRTGMPPSSILMIPRGDQPISSTAWNAPTKLTWAKCSYFLRPSPRVVPRPQWGPTEFPDVPGVNHGALRPFRGI
jgi:hypothetical protein